MSGGASPLERRASEPKGLVDALAFAIGALGLVGAMFTDVIAVVGRQIGIPFLGSVEVAQICVAMIGSAALVVATRAREHANVRVITERLPPAAQVVFARIAQLASALFFLLLLTGAAWIAWEMWGGFEQTELLRFPVIALRVLLISCAAVCVVIFVRHAFQSKDAQ